LNFKKQKTKKGINMKKLLLIPFVIFFSIQFNLNAKEIKGFVKKSNQEGSGNDSPADRYRRFSSNCRAASQGTDLDINNVRTRILNGGDMWWDLNNPRYEIPKVTDPNAIRRHSMFAGALWIGGIGRGDGNLRLAAMTYRQTGVDFWPGPLDTILGTTDASLCEAYDKVWKIERSEILTAEESEWSDISFGMQDWPAGRLRNSRVSNTEPDYLAPFNDLNGNGIYEPSIGEYPVLDDRRAETCNRPANQPDQMLFLVYNDRGNIHSESGGIPIGLEVRLNAFSFATNDEVNNMTFYRSEVINRGNEPLDNTYFGQWVDPDLGNYNDDYVGCDVPRNLGYCYNGDDFDEGILGYGLNPPSIGTTFFEGPRDSSGNELGLYAFVYYNNDWNPVNGNPGPGAVPIHYYNYLQALWKNGQTMTFGGNGVGGSQVTTKMFPGTTDPNFPGQNWDERSAGNSPGDRRYLQSSGPFTLFPGAKNFVTIGVVWARTTSGGATGSLGLLRRASDRAQTLFNNDFCLENGPTAPRLEIQELENELVMKFLEPTVNNENFESNYNEVIINANGDPVLYRFQGYLVYQLKNSAVGTGDLDNIDQARLVFQCDVKDNVTQLINMEYDDRVSQDIPVEKVNGENLGIVRTISLKEDAFAIGSNRSLVNFKTYYYLVMAYGWPVNDSLNLEPRQFLAGRTINRAFGIPHKSEPRDGGVQLNAKYGSGPKLKLLSGRGNGGNVLEFTKETIDEIISKGKAENPIYLNEKGPVRIKVVDPFKIPEAEFEFQLMGDKYIVPQGNPHKDSIDQNSYWFLVNKTTGDTVFSDTTLAYRFESVQGRDRNKKTLTKNSLRDWGFSVEIEQVGAPGYNPVGDPPNGFLSYDIIWADDSKRWLTAVPNIDDVPGMGRSGFFNWIRSGRVRSNPANALTDDHIFGLNANNAPIYIDPSETYEKIWDGRIAPYALCARAGLQQGGTGQVTFGPAYTNSLVLDNPIDELASVDLVITRDRSKWTKCVVLETGEDPNLNQGGKRKFDLRDAPSRDRNMGIVSGDKGMSYFPGYAINVETGERLNIIFGEDSYLEQDNGRDMIWNPSTRFSRPNDPYPAMGGKHFIYVMGSYPGMVTRAYKGKIYDEGAEAKMLLTNPPAPIAQVAKRAVMSQAMWVIPAVLQPGYEIGPDGMPPSDVTIKIRVRKPYTVNEQGQKFILGFNTEDIAPTKGQEQGKRAVDLINIVPNPYYAYSAYENSPVDNRVKITNLPKTCDISIYTLNGTLIRRFKKDDERTFVDWDLKNDFRVPIATGLYIIHVDAKDLGEKILKWYGVMRTLDLDSY
jgi:hypothetical protein